jgi:hypothetical protein
MNKHILFAIALPVLTVMLLQWACSGQNGSSGAEALPLADSSQDPSDQPVAIFDTLAHDFGTIIEGEMVVCYFDYSNQGKAPLMLSSVEATCGCTIPDWSKEPLNPGETQSLKIVFDAEGRSGIQIKTVTVKSNASNSTIRLTLRANVIDNV